MPKVSMTGNGKPFKVLCVDSDAVGLAFVRTQLEKEGLTVTSAASGAEAIRVLEFGKVDLVIIDIGVADIDGLSLLRYVREHFKEIEVMMTAASPTVSEAVQAIKEGAENFLAKPLRAEELLPAVGRLIEIINRRRAVSTDHQPAADGFIGASEAIGKVIERIGRAAATNANVLIHGESGTGKELVARAIHYRSERAAGRFVPVNCTAIPDTLLESELFGHVRGAFTGAKDSRAGYFQIADGGTTFLDEIGDASANMQSKLLRVLQNKEIHVVGSSQIRKIDTRIIAATHKDLLALVKKGLFREDLFYRLVVIDIHIPPLRERPDDILPLANHFLNKFSQEMDRPAPVFSDRALEAIKNHGWPGNVRELENLIQRLLVNTDGDKVDAADLPDGMRAALRFADEGLRTLADVESSHIRRVLEAVEGNKTAAAGILGIDRKTLREKLKKISSAVCLF